MKAKDILAKVNTGEVVTLKKIGTVNKVSIFDYVFLPSEEELNIALGKTGLKATATDFARANGVLMETPESDNKPQGVGYCLRQMENKVKNIRSVSCLGAVNENAFVKNAHGIRPCVAIDLQKLKKDDVAKLNIQEVVDPYTNIKYHTLELGRYPSTIVDRVLADKLKKINHSLPKGREYVVDDVNNTNDYKTATSFWYEDKEYIQIQSVRHDIDSKFSDGQPVENGDQVILEVKPITWRIMNWGNLPQWINPVGYNSCETIRLISDQVIMGNLSWHINNIENYRWVNSPIRGFLNGIDNRKYYYNVDGTPYKVASFIDDALNVDIDLKLDGIKVIDHNANPYHFQFTDMNNDQLLQAYVASGTSVFLHGPSGVGKSERVKQIDPTATRITLRPQMNPEEIDGTLDRTTGDYIQPLWYKQLCEKCKAEPDRQHVLFIDELTNVKPTVQSLVYSIVLDHAGKDGLWPLPDNSVVVAAGNESADNLAAYPMTNALYRRFCHITYNVDKQNWLNWACGEDSIQPATTTTEEVKETRQRIHPSIVAYMMSRKEDILYQELDEEKPSIVVDPRKWEIASDVLYATHNPNSLKPAIGEELTADFADFVSKINLSVDDVVSGNYTKEEYEYKNMSERLAAMAGLTNATEKNLTAVRQFIRDNLGKEILSNYDLIWTNNNPDRALAVADSNIELSELDQGQSAVK